MPNMVDLFPFSNPVGPFQYLALHWAYIGLNDVFFFRKEVLEQKIVGILNSLGLTRPIKYKVKYKNWTKSHSLDSIVFVPMG